jgi:hypothetical protein
MQTAGKGLAFLLASSFLAPAVTQAGSSAAEESPAAAVPLFRVSFERRDAVTGISATHVIKLPWQCTSDGTIFVSFVGTVSADSGLPPPAPGPLPMLLTSISPSGRGQTFRLDQVPELHVSSELDHYASDSEVIFLVTAAREIKPVQEAYSVGSYHGEVRRNAAEQHLYILSFSREGEFKASIEIEDSFRIQHLAEFPSGTFLVFGLDRNDHSAKLVMLKPDGTWLRSLEIPKGDTPAPMVSGKDGPRRSVTAASELIPEGRSIVVVQNRTGFPLLEVSEGGAIREIHPKLAKNEQIESLIPADQNLYVVASEETVSNGRQEHIYEVSPEDGTVLRRIELGDGRGVSDAVACVHEGKFLSIDFRNGQVVPLVGTAEPASVTIQQKR